MSDKRIEMTTKEIDRCGVMKRVKEREISQTCAASEILCLSDRQVRRLYKRYKDFGPEGVVRKNSKGNRGFDQNFKLKTIEIIRNNYTDFTPTFASEKLEELHGIKVNRETLRQWMMSEKLWKGKKRKKARIHQSRERRPRVGELIQIDGSHHDWFEGRAPKCCLIVFIDDATSCIMAMNFVPTETCEGYFSTLKTYLKMHGVPVAFYSDKHGIFVDNHKDVISDTPPETQFQRAIQTLGIEQICAHSPQAKGRVERANKTLQDRLIKEMRLLGISSIEEANMYLPDFIQKHNARFSVPPEKKEDMHKPLTIEDDELNRILSHQETRTLSKNLELSYRNTIYKIIYPGIGYALRKTKVRVCEEPDGKITILKDNKILEYETINKLKQITHFAESKEINEKLDKILIKKTACGNVENSSSFHTIPQGTTTTSINI